MRTQAWLWGASGASVALAVLAGLAESRRSRRRHLDGHGWMPWRGLQMTAIFLAVTLAVLAARI